METKILSWDALRASIESDEYFADIAIASGTKSLWRRIAKDPYFAQLVDFLQSNPDSIQTVLKYANDIARSTVGVTRHTNEIALCTILIALASATNADLEDLLRYLRTSEVLALKLPRAIASMIVGQGTLTRQVVVSLGSPIQDGGNVLYEYGQSSRSGDMSPWVDKLTATA